MTSPLSPNELQNCLRQNKNKGKKTNPNTILHLISLYSTRLAIGLHVTSRLLESAVLELED